MSRIRKIAMLRRRLRAERRQVVAAPRKPTGWLPRGGAVLMVLLCLCNLGLRAIASADSTGTDCDPQMSAADCQALLHNWPNWIIENDSSCSADTSDDSTADANLSGSDPMEKAYNYFIGKQLSPITAAAIVGNLIQESNVNSKEGGGYIAQWGGSRLTGLQSFAQAKGEQVTSLALQLDYIATELRILPVPSGIAIGDYSDVLKTTTSKETISDATAYFMGTASAGTGAGNVVDSVTRQYIAKYGRFPGYENPGSPYLNKRIGDAKSVLRLYGNNQASGDASTTTGTSDSADSQCSGDGSDGSGSIGGSGTGNFTTDTSTAAYPGLQKMLDNVNRAAAPNSNKPGPKSISNSAVCGSSSCAGTCMHTVAALWGWSNSGYGSPYQNTGTISMMNALKGTKYWHPGSRNVPVGAALIYSGTPGHVVIYLGNNLIVSTDTNSDGGFDEGGGIHVVSADSIEKKWGMHYVGWADPYFHGQLGYGPVNY